MGPDRLLSVDFDFKQEIDEAEVRKNPNPSPSHPVQSVDVNCSQDKQKTSQSTAR
jgi:hypothetical protein